MLERNPSLNWIVYTVGDLSLGVDPALKAAGILGKVSIGGNAPDQTNLIAVRNGTETAWTGFSTPILGFRDADMMARYFAGDSLSPAGEPRRNSPPAPRDGTGQAWTDRDWCAAATSPRAHD